MNSTIIKLKYKCCEPGCEKSYDKPFKLEVHKRRHNGERPFSCNVPNCNKSYTQKPHLKRHTCIVHDKSEEIICPEKDCGLVFNNKYALKKHTRIHSPNFEYKCGECKAGFHKKHQLRKHLLTHNGEPLRCNICHIHFTNLHLYNKHKKNHKTYTCDCKEIFNRWTLFCKHRRSFCSIKKIDHECIICQKVFKTKKNLTQHSFSHLDESKKEIFRCPYFTCKRTYAYKKNLVQHINVFHEKVQKRGEFKCMFEGCSQVLMSKKTLKQHQKVHIPKLKQPGKQKPRKDKGKSKKSMASIVAGIKESIIENKTMKINEIKTANCFVELRKINEQIRLKDSEKTVHPGNNAFCEAIKDLKKENKSSVNTSNTKTNKVIKELGEQEVFVNKAVFNSKYCCVKSLEKSENQLNQVSFDDMLINHCNQVLSILQDCI